MKEKILIIHNTDYHTEVTLSYYGVLESNNFDPYIYSIYNHYDIKNLFKEYKLNYIEEYKTEYKNIFKKAFLITPMNKMTDFLPNFRYRKGSSPNYEDNLVQDFKSKIILVFHKPSKYQKDFLYINNDFPNFTGIGLSPVSQALGLNYLFPLDNTLAKSLTRKNHINDKVKFLLIGRFGDIHFRRLDYIIGLTKINNLKQYLLKDFEIIVVGEQAENIISHFKNIDYVKIKSNLNEIDFYKEVNDADFILNLLENNSKKEYNFDVLTSNYNHSFSFRKPQICNEFANLICPIPSITFIEEDFSSFFKAFEKAVNISNENYQRMITNFEIPINNMRLHNAQILNNII